MRSERSPSDLGVLVLLTLSTALLGFVFLKPGIALDGISYFAYLRSAAQDGDLVLLDEFTRLGVARADFNMTPEGQVRNVFPIGSAVLWLPFYMTGHRIALFLEQLTGADPDHGYSLLHVFFVYVGTVCLGLAALFVSYRLARSLCGRGAALHATIAVWIASPFIYYQYIEGDYSHIPSALLVAVFVAHWYRTWGQRRVIDYAVLGYLAGVTAMVRWQHVLVLVLPLCEVAAGLGARVASRTLRFGHEVVLGRLRVQWTGSPNQEEPFTPLPRFGELALFLAAMLLGAAPQLAHWKVAYDQWLTIPQGGGFLRWDRPEILPTLFSSFHGLFGWHPLLLLAVTGLLFLSLRVPRLALPLLLFFALETYVNSIVWDWEAGVSFGGRRFVGLTVLFVIGLARVYRTLGPRLSGVLTALAAVGNLLLLYEFHFGLVSRRWLVSFDELIRQHLRLLADPLALLASFWRDHLARLWPEATWTVLGPAIVLLAGTAAVLAARGRFGRPAHLALIVLLVAAEGAFVRAALVSEPAPIRPQHHGGFALIDYRWYENGHYQLDPFHPDYPGKRHFLGLAGEKLSWGSIPFTILDPLAQPLANACALTTCHLVDAAFEIPLVPWRTRSLWLAVDGGAFADHPGATAGRLEIVYEDGSTTGLEVIEGREVNDYWRPAPEDRVLWRGEPPADLTCLRLPADSTRTVKLLKVVSRSSRSGPAGPGFTVFAITQEPVTGDPVPVSIAEVANTDFMQDPFRPYYLANHFPTLEPGVHNWRGVPFLILDVDPVTGRGTVITTAYLDRMRLKIPLVEAHSNWVQLVVDGAGIRGLKHLHLGEILVHYDRGRPSVVHLQAGVNVWDYFERPDPEFLIWEGLDDESLSVIGIETDPGRTPRALEIRSAGQRGNNNIVAGFAVFAITQKLAAEAGGSSAVASR